MLADDLVRTVCSGSWRTLCLGTRAGGGGGAGGDTAGCRFRSADAESRDRDAAFREVDSANGKSRDRDSKSLAAAPPQPHVAKSCASSVGRRTKPQCSDQPRAENPGGDPDANVTPAELASATSASCSLRTANPESRSRDSPFAKRRFRNCESRDRDFPFAGAGVGNAGRPGSSRGAFRAARQAVQLRSPAGNLHRP